MEFQQVPRFPTAVAIDLVDLVGFHKFPESRGFQRIPEASRALWGRESGVNLRSHAGNTEMLTEWDTENLNL
jgi:hypothetical protein